MESLKVDHTNEVEKRITAIHISQNDSCIFFQIRDGCLLPEKTCYTCRHGLFIDGCQKSGVCKFKR